MDIGIQRRNSRLSYISNHDFDVIIIGGGISGASLFANLAASGYDTLLVDKEDFASATSQASGMMIWGGLLYLTKLDFKTVHSLCRNRDALIERYPQKIRPQYYYYLPLRHGWQFTPLVKGLLDFYRLLGGMRRGKNYIQRDFAESSFLQMGKYRGALAYEEGMLNTSDCHFVLDLIHRYDSSTAIPLNYVAFDKAEYERSQKRWHIGLVDRFAGREFSVTARLVINASGPYTDQINDRFGICSPFKHVFSKGVYLAFPRPHGHTNPLIFEMGRHGDVQTFVPWGPVSYWGPTETSLHSLEGIEPSIKDVQFLLKQANDTLNYRLGIEDIISYRAGVRALAVKSDYHAKRYPLELSRNHRVHLDRERPWITAYGGKFTSGDTLAMMVRNKAIGVLGQPRYPGVVQQEQPRVGDMLDFPGLNTSFPAIGHCVDYQYCLTIEDYLRRRTNIAQWLPRNGLGRNNENKEFIRSLIKQLPQRQGTTPDTVLDTYINETDRIFNGLKASDK